MKSSDLLADLQSESPSKSALAAKWLYHYLCTGYDLLNISADEVDVRPVAGITHDLVAWRSKLMKVSNG